MQMQKIEVVLRNEAGLHARPASRFVRESNRYKSDIYILNEGIRYNAKSIMSILSSGIEEGTKLIIQAEGEDEKEAVAALRDLVDNNFGEQENET